MRLTKNLSKITIHNDDQLIKFSQRISKQADKLVQWIRDYSTSQKSLWRKIPYLALEADGRTGYNDNYGRAYSSGLWHIGYSMYVDLESGNLVDSYAASRSFSIGDYDCEKESNLISANSENVLQLVYQIEVLNTSLLVNQLAEEGKKKYLAIYNPKEVEKWRDQKREEFSIEKYTKEKDNFIFKIVLSKYL